MKLHLIILYVVIGALLCSLFYVGCKRPKCPEPMIVKTDTSKKVDTFYVYIDTTVHHEPTVTQEIVRADKPAHADRQTNSDSIKTAYNQLVDSYYAIRITRDTFEKDGNFLYQTDTVTKNRITGRMGIAHLTSPVITNTNTVTNTVVIPPRRKVLIGGAALGNESQVLGKVEGDIIYKDRKDRLYGITASKEFNGQAMYGVRVLFPISFK